VCEAVRAQQILRRRGGEARERVLAIHTVFLEKASAAELKPHKIENSLAFMWESKYVFRPTKFALGAPQLQQGYDAAWSGFKKHFK
jgi:homogentisate 1,2-dioxygenase